MSCRIFGCVFGCHMHSNWWCTSVCVCSLCEIVFVDCTAAGAAFGLLFWVVRFCFCSLRFVWCLSVARIAGPRIYLTERDGEKVRASELVWKATIRKRNSQYFTENSCVSATLTQTQRTRATKPKTSEWKGSAQHTPFFGYGNIRKSWCDSGSALCWLCSRCASCMHEINSTIGQSERAWSFASMDVLIFTSSRFVSSRIIYYWSRNRNVKTDRTASTIFCSVFLSKILSFCFVCVCVCLVVLLCRVVPYRVNSLYADAQSSIQN